MTSGHERIARSLAVGAVVALILGFALSGTPTDKSDDVRDFSQFYAAAQMVWHGLGGKLYDIDLQATFISQVAAVHTFYNHPPFQTIMFVPLTLFTYPTAFAIWTITSFCMLLAATWLIELRTGLGWAISNFTGIRADFGLVLALFLTFAPATTCILTGQDSMVTLLIYALVFSLLKRNWQFGAGCVLGTGLFKFQFILPFVLVLMLRRKWSSLAGFAVSGSLLVLVSIAISGVQVLWEYPRFLLFDTRYQPVAGFQPEYMPNIRGIVYLLLDGWTASWLLNALIAAFSLAVLWFAARRWRDEDFEMSFSRAILAVILASYHLYIYDLTLILLPSAILLAETARQRKLLSKTPLLAAAIGILIVHPLHRTLVQSSIYALMSIPVLMLFVEALPNPFGTRFHADGA